MIQVRQGRERGRSRHGWLESDHTFSFADYYDPEHVSFGALRVINEDRVAPGKGFDTHPHRDMEIVSYVLEGALEHRDSMGNGSIIRPGEVQRMSAGTGLTHSEFNHFVDRPLHFLQIWIIPERRGIEPSYEQRPLSTEERRGKLCLAVSRDGREGSVTIQQDADFYLSLLEPDDRVVHVLRPGRRAWLQVTQGAMSANGCALAAGDGAAVSSESTIEIVCARPSELLLIDLA